MATLSVGQKAQKHLRFLMGLRHPVIAQALAKHGFTNDDLDEGWALLRRQSAASLDGGAQGPKAAGPETIGRLDAWENKWFPIASATLARHAPEVHAWLFRNLSQTQGLQVVVSVGTFVRRFALLARPESEGGMGEKGEAARRLLARRGLTPQAVEGAEALLRELGTVATEAPGEGPSKEERDAASAEAEAAMWAWYQEWSTIARMAIADRSLLRLLGIGRPGRRKGKGAGSGGGVDGEPAGDGSGDGDDSDDGADETDDGESDAAE
ncbi:MAG TPA: hypothetical protein VFS43_22230 [Polyangiaceae bacterium]|nr:hypothetical protein [Polyangiaceae bacterium]